MTTERAGLREIERRRDSAEANYRSDSNPEDHDYWLGRKEAFDEALALATPDEPVAGLDVERLARAIFCATHATALAAYDKFVPPNSANRAEHEERASEVASLYARLAEEPDHD